MPKKVKIGDIIEIPVSNGFAYAQYAHKVKGFCELIRILNGVFSRRPENFIELANKHHQFVTFFPLGAAVNRGIFVVVAHETVPEEAQSLPIFRVAGGIDKTGKVLNWWLWDGKKEWRVDQLTPEQYKLPIKSIPNDTALIEMIEENWTPETDKWRGINSISS